MKLSHVVNEDIERLQESLLQKEQEQLASASTTSEVLAKLNISIENLPQKCQRLLHQASTAQTSSELDQFDPAIIIVHQSREIVEKLDDEYEILNLRHKHEQLRVKIDRNNRFVEQLKMDLAQSRERLAKQTPNPESIQEFCRQMKKKVASYEESCEKAKSNFANLSVPEHAMPASLATLAASLATLSEQAASLRRSAEDIQLAREARDALRLLMRR